MSALDVSELLVDPDVAGTGFTVIRREEIINDNGRSVVTENRITAAGSVFPTGDNSLAREAAFQAQGKSLTVVTLFRLRGVAQGGGKQYQPDLVEWNGSRYTVREVEDFTRYGAGFIKADCTSQDFVDPPAPEESYPVGQLLFYEPGQSGLIGAVA